MHSNARRKVKRHPNLKHGDLTVEVPTEYVRTTGFSRRNALRKKRSKNPNNVFMPRSARGKRAIYNKISMPGWFGGGK